jgi:hypothetical protein
MLYLGYKISIHESYNALRLEVVTQFFFLDKRRNLSCFVRMRSLYFSLRSTTHLYRDSVMRNENDSRGSALAVSYVTPVGYYTSFAINLTLKGCGQENGRYNTFWRYCSTQIRETYIRAGSERGIIIRFGDAEQRFEPDRFSNIIYSLTIALAIDIYRIS